MMYFFLFSNRHDFLFWIWNVAFLIGWCVVEKYNMFPNSKHILTVLLRNIAPEIINGGAILSGCLTLSKSAKERIRTIKE